MVELCTTYDQMEAELIKAKLTDENIPFAVNGEFMDAYSVSAVTRIAMHKPIKFYVEQGYLEIAKVLINTDRSSTMDEDLEYE